MTVQDIDTSTFEAGWAEWHRRHEELRADPHGFLAITGRHWLTAEPQRFDDAPGAWSASADGVVVTLDDEEELAVAGERVRGTYRFAPIPERGQVNGVAGDAVIEVARRGGHMIVRPRHPSHPTRTGYAGTPPTPRTRAGSLRAATCRTTSRGTSRSARWWRACSTCTPPPARSSSPWTARPSG